MKRKKIKELLETIIQDNERMIQFAEKCIEAKSWPRSYEDFCKGAREARLLLMDDLKRIKEVL